MSRYSRSFLMLTLLAMNAVRILAQPAPDAVRSPTVKPQRTAQITGRVVDETGKPITGLNLRAVISDADFGRLTAHLWHSFTMKDKTGKSVTGYSYNGPPPEDVIGRTMICPNIPTGSDGRYTFTALTTGSYYLMEGGNLDTGKVMSPTVVQAQEGETVQAPDIVVSQAVTIHGQVVAREGGNPLPGVILRYFDAVHPFAVSWFMSSYRNRRGTLTTDKNGRFTLQTAPGAAQFFVAGSGKFFEPKDLLLTGRQRENWPSGQNIYGQTIWGVKSGVNVYAANCWVMAEVEGQPAQDLAHGQWLQVQVEAQHDVSLVFRLDRLVFKNGKTPVVPDLNILQQGDPGQSSAVK
jgi:protocatechuate 3,4-dioxygenase beta subunit